MDLKKDDLSLAMEAIMSMRVPFLYGYSLQHCFTMEDHLSRLNFMTFEPSKSMHVKNMILLFYYFIFM